MMVELDLQKETLVSNEDEANKSSLREERQRTGRYIAIGTAIFLSLLGSYQAVVSGTPQYAALFAPALIMFIYILWILNASANQRKALQAAAAAATYKYDTESVVEIEMESPKTSEKSAMIQMDTMSANMEGKMKDIGPQMASTPAYPSAIRTRMYSRSYSIA